MEIIATATFGLESVVGYEIKKLGYEQIQVENSRVIFQGDQMAVCRANLWLRSADRVLIRVGNFKAVSFEELFEQTKALPWSDYLPSNACFPVEGKSVKSQLHSVPDCQAIVKKAIVEQMKSRYHLNWFPENGPRYTIEVALLKDQVTLTLDSSGSGLHKRGYRKLTGLAPLKETLAAAILNLGRWYPDRVLWDPCCGTGTIPIEAALLAHNLAPGLNRSFAAEAWPNWKSKNWKLAREEAKDLADLNAKVRIQGTDIDPQALKMARYHAQLAGVEKSIHFQQLPLQKIRSRYQYGFLVANPPYGQRLGDLREAEQLYRDLGRLYKSLPDWSCLVITSHPGWEKKFGRKADKNRKLYNGRTECHLYQYRGASPAVKNSASNQSK